MIMSERFLADANDAPGMRPSCATGLKILHWRGGQKADIQRAMPQQERINEDATHNGVRLRVLRKRNVARECNARLAVMSS